MPPCRFWAQGNCRKGESCTFEHSGPGGTAGGNRFNALSNNAPNNAFGGGRGGGAGRGGGGGGGADRNKPSNSNHQFGVDPELIRLDLTTDRPEWPFSCYGPGTRAPLQLIDGYPFEQSFEEIRLINYQAILNGNVEAARQAEGVVLKQINDKIKLCVDNPQEAANFVISGKDSPNSRINQTFTDGKQPQNQNQANNAFASAPRAPAAFGQAGGFPSRQPAAFGQSSMPGQSSAFGRSAALASTAVFGQASQPGAPAFGQPSNHAEGSAFNRSAAFAPTSGFGAPSAPATSSTFGQAPSLSSNQRPAFGQTSQPASTFGQASQMGQASAFVPSQTQNATFGQPSQPGAAPGFGQQPQPTQGSAFPQNAQPTQNSGFGNAISGAPAFGQSSQPSGFATQPSGSQQAPSAPPFGTPIAAASPGASQQSTASASAQPSNGFGLAACANTSGQTQPQPNDSASIAPETKSSTFSVSTADHCTRDLTGKIMTFKNRPVSYQVWPEEGAKPDQRRVPFYRPNGNDWERIFIEEMPATIPGTQPQITSRTEAAELAEAYKFAVENGKFKDGIMPELAPKREWVSFDL